MLLSRDSNGAVFAPSRTLPSRDGHGAVFGATDRSVSVLGHLRLTDASEAYLAIALERSKGRRTRVGTQIERFRDEHAPAQYPVCALIGAFGILPGRDRVVIAVIPIRAPLQDVTGHVVSAEWRCVVMRQQVAAFAPIVKTDRRYGIRSVGVDVVRVRRVDFVSPRISPLIDAARCLFPFGFGRQAVLLAVLALSQLQ